MKIPLPEYLDKLEATAKAADERTHGAIHAEPDGKIDDEMGPWGSGWTESIQEHILATQPKATLALIAKLREAVQIVSRAAEIASRTRAEWVADPRLPALVINEFQDDVVSWANIEVPE